MKILMWLVLSVCALSTSAQTDSVLKRKPYHLVVPVDQETAYEEDLKESAYIHPDNTVQLYPGESVFIEIEWDQGKIQHMKAVSENKNPEKTLTISFKQSLKDDAHEFMKLEILNPFVKVLHYKAVIYIFHARKWVETDVFPVKAGISGIEIWPDLITSIALGDWTFHEN